jgi:RNA polymerase sigma-70 factor (ECF subfamily)
VISALAAGDPGVRERALEVLAATYWRPVYSYIRLKWRAQPGEAEDMTQEFFVRALERDFFAQYDPSRARFRTWLRLGIDRMMVNAREAAGRLKRGGGTVTVPLDLPELERSVALRARDPLPDDDELFRREVARTLFSVALLSLMVLRSHRVIEHNSGDGRIQADFYEKVRQRYGSLLTLTEDRIWSVSSLDAERPKRFPTAA